MKFGVVVFPGSNCDHDAWYAVSRNLGAEAQFLWHKDTSIPGNIDCIILPGGFSFGDYLRCGAVAKFSPIMNEVIRIASSGKPVIGICNGFQILTETGLLEGALYRNAGLNFICRDVFLKTMNNSTLFTSKLNDGDVLRIPIAHGEGNYIAEERTIRDLEDGNRIVFKYCMPGGEILPEANPNGSANNIAGIINKSGNVLGMMPHPERYSDVLLGCNNGLSIFDSILKNV